MASSVAVVGNTLFRVVFPLYLPGLKLICVCTSVPSHGSLRDSD